jgi:predicted amidohydrolase YtcJ
VIAFNTKALQQLGVDQSTPARVGNVWIEKDSAGNPTGILSGSVTNYYSHDSFNESLWSRIPYIEVHAILPATERAMAQYNAQGITTIYENHEMEAPFIDAYRELRRSDRLTLRVALVPGSHTHRAG